MIRTVILLVLSSQCFSQEQPIYTINSKKSLHTVSDKFLSFSIDPAALLTGLNLSHTTLQMAQKLSPAFLRIAGPSTQFLKYGDDYWDPNSLNVNPTMWFGITEWLSSANLTPVFGINEAMEADILDVADKFNVSCYWQLGYDCNGEQYQTNLERFKLLIDKFPRQKWKIVGSDPTKCITDVRKVLPTLENVVAALVLEQSTNVPKTKIPLWFCPKKTPHPASFQCALSWAKDLGDAGKNGYAVILRQLRLHEMYTTTPPFWVSFLHKMLMGRTVLDIKTTASHPQVSVFAHCTRNQSDFSKSGSMTIFMVNDGATNGTVLVKTGTNTMRNTEVRSYILTSEEDSSDVFLNGEKMNMNMKISSKLRLARTWNYLSLSLPPKSVGFFVLPEAQITVCSNEEDNLNHIIEEIENDQNLQLKDEMAIKPRQHPTLHQIQAVMEKELESDERFYKQLTMKKKHDFPKRKDITFKPKKEQKKEDPKTVFELELTSSEIKKVLADRAKTKAAKKNIIFTSHELEEIMNKATQKILNNKNAAIRIRKKDKRDINMKLLKMKAITEKKKHEFHSTKRPKRDINMDMLKIKTKKQKTDAEIFADLEHEIRKDGAIKPKKKSKVFSKLHKTSTTETPKKSEELDLDNFDDYECIHEFSAEKVDHDAKPKNATEMWETPEVKLSKRMNDKFEEWGSFEKYIEDSADVDDYETIEIGRFRRGTDQKQYKLWRDRLLHRKNLIERKNNFNERYKSLTDGVKKWKPSDILTLKQKRSVDHQMDSVENEIGNFMSEVMKESTMMKPKLDKEHGDYQLVFPNKDKIEVQGNQGDTEVKLVLHGTPTTESNIQKISKTHKDDMWDKLFKKMSKFVKGLSAKLRKYIMNDLLGDAA